MRFVLVGILAASVGCGSVIKSKCGDGMVSGTEACDEGAMNGDAASCCSSECTLVAAGVTCRASLGVCDIAETCSGTEGACPADMTMPDGMACSGGNGSNECSAADTCKAGACANNDLAVGDHCNGDACRLETCNAAHTCPGAGTKVVTITDSHTTTPSENMDLQWQTVATSMGYTATIVPRTTLDTLSNLAGTDILIVASSTQALTPAERDNVAAFIASGHGVYVQGEYIETFAGNVLFQALVAANGGSFTWGPDITGQFNAVPVGCFGTTPNAAMMPFNQNYGVTGTSSGAGISSVQVDEGTTQPIAFAFCRSGGGEVIVKTDQDDIRTPPAGSSVLDLMKNILYRLTYASSCVQ
jgi:hypothetical protein